MSGDSDRPALILVGHGSARHPDSARPIHDLAATLRASGRFAEVTAAFMKQAPFLAPPETLVQARRVVVVPIFAGTGYYTDTLIPRAMKLDGPRTLRDGRVILYTPPAGGHPRMPALLCRRAALAAAAAGMEPADTALILVAHGSGRPGGAGETPRRIEAAITEMGVFAETHLVFLEQAPFATGWRDLTPRRQVVALPLLVARGTHASEDIPPLFQASAADPGRRIALAAGLGEEPDLADIVLDLAGGD